MAKSHYDWKNGPAKLQQHSVAKHNLLRSYLSAYFPTLVSSPHQEELRLTIVDGFAGGGAYTHSTTGELVLGSPFICLQAVKEAEARINQSVLHWRMSVCRMSFKGGVCKRSKITNVIGVRTSKANFILISSDQPDHGSIPRFLFVQLKGMVTSGCYISRCTGRRAT